MNTCPEYRIYLAGQKVAQLYRQLPEACVAVQKTSRNLHRRGSLDLQQPYPQSDDDDKCEKGFCPTHVSLDGSSADYSESLFEKNEMYQLRQVLHCLRRGERLCAFPCGGKAVPGLFYSFCMPFTAEPVEEDAQGVVLRSAETENCTRLRLFCEPNSFYGADWYAARLFAWEGGGALPLAGTMLCLSAGGNGAAGLPLYLAIRNNQ